MAFGKGLNPDVVLSGLDALFITEFESPAGPQMATALDSGVFRQSSTPWSAVSTQVMNDPGLWSETAEFQELSQAQIQSGAKRNFTVINYKQALPISRELMRDEGYGAVAAQVSKMALNARETRDREAFGIYRNAFTSTLTNAGTALISDSHTTISGDVVDNKVTGPLSETTLNTAIQLLVEQKNQSGTIGGFSPACLLVPPALFKLACEIVESEVRTGVNNGEMNVYSTKYGITIKQSRWLGAAAGGSDTAFFLNSKMHPVTRWEREGVSTDFVPAEYSSNDVSYYKGRFAEVVGATTYEGMVGAA